MSTGDTEHCEVGLYLATRVCGAGDPHLLLLDDNH